MWQILHSSINRAIKNIKYCTKELEEAKKKLNEVKRSFEMDYSQPYFFFPKTNEDVSMSIDDEKNQEMIESIEKLEEKLDSYQNEQKNLFLIIFQRFIMVLSDHIRCCEFQGRSYRNYWFFWTMSRLQEIFFKVII